MEREVQAVCCSAFVRSGNSAVSGVRSSVVRARGCWEVAVGGAPDVKFALCTVI